jgi:hypothetical protein
MNKTATKNPPKRVAIVHEFLMKMGGAERVVKSLAKIYPDADIYTLVYDQDLVKNEFPAHRIIGSGLQQLPSFFRKRYRFFFPYFRRAVEN